MQTQGITVSRDEALVLFRKYKEHQHYSTPVDHEIQRTYEAIAKGRMVIQALHSITHAGLNEEGLPKLAIVRADATDCFLEMIPGGGARFALKRWSRDEHTRTYIDLPRGSFPLPTGRVRTAAVAQVPLIPIHLRPKRGLQNYHILFEAEWTRIPPRDPMLLRRIGKADLWLVLAAWDLTEVERAVLAGRL